MEGTSGLLSYGLTLLFLGVLFVSLTHPYGLQVFLLSYCITSARLLFREGRRRKDAWGKTERKSASDVFWVVLEVL